LKKLNAGDYGAVPAQFARWRIFNGQPNLGLLKRRAIEVLTWKYGVGDPEKTRQAGYALGQRVWDTSGGNNLAAWQTAFQNAEAVA
jgi:hypothetical protein